MFVTSVRLLEEKNGYQDSGGFHADNITSL
jgi:hypothetical protein